MQIDHDGNGAGAAGAERAPSAGSPRRAGSGGASIARPSALVLAGASAKGPFTAGALSAVARHRDRFAVRSVVGASSGALNGAVYAAGLRVGQPERAAKLLETLWRDRARFPGILTWNTKKQIVKDALLAFKDEEPAPDGDVQLCIIVASLAGTLAKMGNALYTSFEDAHVFGRDAFASDAGIDEIAEFAVASAALPVLFPPRQVRQGGPYWDGGIVNNTPIGKALRDDVEIDHLLIVTPDARIAAPKRRFSRWSLPRLLEMVIEERLYRDLRTARSFNEELVRLGRFVSPEILRRELKWRVLELIEIRPEHALEGGLLSGFFSRDQRASYIEDGRRVAESVLETFQASEPAAEHAP